MTKSSSESFLNGIYHRCGVAILFFVRAVFLSLHLLNEAYRVGEPISHGDDRVVVE